MLEAFGAWSVVDVLAPRLATLAREPAAPGAFKHLVQQLCRHDKQAEAKRLQTTLGSNMQGERFRGALDTKCKRRPRIPPLRRR